MDKATMGTYLEMLRAIEFVIDTNNFALRVQPERKLVSAHFVTVIGREIL
jgi:hypothetical protein